MRVVAVLLIVGAELACTRTFAPLSADHPGTLAGRALTLGLDGSWVPAVGAQASILSTSLAAVSDADGRFLLSGIAHSGGQLLLAYSSTGTVTLDQQVLISLANVGVGPGVQAQLGDVQLAVTGGVSGHLAR